jgi:hypothetical protein
MVLPPGKHLTFWIRLHELYNLLFSDYDKITDILLVVITVILLNSEAKIRNY